MHSCNGIWVNIYWNQHFNTRCADVMNTWICRNRKAMLWNEIGAKQTNGIIRQRANKRQGGRGVGGRWRSNNESFVKIYERNILHSSVGRFNVNTSLLYFNLSLHINWIEEHWHWNTENCPIQRQPKWGCFKLQSREQNFKQNRDKKMLKNVQRNIPKW